MRVVWSPLAIERAVEQARYIAGDKPDAARKWLAHLFARTGKLAKLPRLGRVVPELGLSDFRELKFGVHRIFYRVERRPVSILTVRHGRRLLDRRELEPRRILPNRHSGAVLGSS